MTLKSFGCSFIYGSDLPDDGRKNPFNTNSIYTWPSLLAKDLGRNYECYAMPGVGNLYILERVLENAANDTSDSLYIIGWTWIDRFDYIDPVKTKWRTIMPGDTSDIATNYYRDLHTQYRDKLTTLTYIKTAADLLCRQNIPFIMTCMDELIWEPETHAELAFRYLQNFLYPHFRSFDNKTFLNWSRCNGFKISENWHPLEDAHAAAADYAKNHFFV